MNLSIAIVILNWNGKTLLETFLPSVLAYSKEATVYVADNASTDDSVSFVKETFPEVSIIQNKINGGYAKGYNDALKSVNEDIFCLLNSDIEVTEGWLTPIISEYNTGNADIIQPKILDYKNKTMFEYAGAGGGFIDKYAFPYCRGRIFNTIEKDEGQFNDTSEIFWASGACLFIKKEVFNALQGFDESFFAHMEEIDLCWRAFNLNYTVKYVGTSTVFHVGGATLNATNPRKTYLNFRNSLATLTKNANGNVFTTLFVRMVLDGIAGIHFLFQLKPKHTWSVLKAHFSFYCWLPRLLKQRKQLKTRKKHYNKTSIVWNYYVSNKKRFRNL